MMGARLTGIAVALAALLAVAAANNVEGESLLVSAKTGDGFDYFMFVRSVVSALRAPLRCLIESGYFCP